MLETTGLAEPAPILHALFADPRLAVRLELHGVVALVDAVNGGATLAARPEAARQVALADRIVVAKTDLVAEATRALQLAELSGALAALNPVAPILDGAAGEFPAAEFLAVAPALPSRAAAGGVSESGGHRVQTFSFRTETPVDPAAFAGFLSALSAMVGPRLLRFKGLIALAGRPEAPLLIEGVQHVFHSPRALAGWPDADHSTRTVLIGDGVSVREAGTLWAALTRTPAIDFADLAALTDNPLKPRAGGLFG